jgi:hypothetical protein
MQLASHRLYGVSNLCDRGCQGGLGNTKLSRPISNLVLLFHADLAAVLRTSLRAIVCHWRSPCSFTNITRNEVGQFQGTQAGVLLP